ncbi:hypothetical protein LTS08_008012 [Lithohypha guttulata]|uniref:Uncharacterized protein n=1 Tax=Lithohypha guttulata TaxID=1690604 RepID=A0AAN7TGH5_9EURO|nr:hypothetical protein LTR51_004634 [Lithohypha guttulata]KAK5091241.1 hypothetical protein LTR05_001422 [Lithohypha guttulata]KAK5095619.1 hypothetical protein LTS08_008012 [Lithohypha guttulata]
MSNGQPSQGSPGGYIRGVHPNVPGFTFPPGQLVVQVPQQPQQPQINGIIHQPPPQQPNGYMYYTVFYHPGGRRSW